MWNNKFLVELIVSARQAEKIITVQQFVSDANDYASQFTDLSETNAKRIIDYLKTIVIPLRIQLVYENPSCLVNKAEDGSTRFRIIMFTQRYKADFRVPLVRHSNGLITVGIKHNLNLS